MHVWAWRLTLVGQFSQVNVVRQTCSFFCPLVLVAFSHVGMGQLFFHLMGSTRLHIITTVESAMLYNTVHFTCSS